MISRPRVSLLLIFLIGLAATLTLANPRSLPLGVHTLHPDDLTMQKVHDIGARYIVQVFAWREIEPSPGEFHWEYTDWLVRAAEFYNLNVVARLDKPPVWTVAAPDAVSSPPRNLNDYGDFAARVAQRYRGHIAGYVVWNEPNLAIEWGNSPPDPGAYTDMLKLAAGRIRAVDDKAQIVSAGLAPTNENSPGAMDDRTFLRAMYAHGAREAFDVLGAHPYGFGYPPEDNHGDHDGLNFARLNDLHEIMVNNGDSNKPIWVTEFGYTTEPPSQAFQPGVSETQQADYLARGFAMARDQYNFVKLFTVWNFSPELPPADEQAGYSLIRPDRTAKSAFSSVEQAAMPSALTQLLTRLRFGLSSPVKPEYSVLARDVLVHLGDSEYIPPWVPLYQTLNPSPEWNGEFYLTDASLNSSSRDKPWILSMELMQVNDFDSRVIVNDRVTDPAFLPTEDFTGRWVTAQFKVAPEALHVGKNVVTIRAGKLFPAFQQSGFTWDDFQFRNVVLLPPDSIPEN